MKEGSFAGKARPCLRSALVLGACIFASMPGVAQEVIPDYYNEPGLNPNREYINQAAHEHIDPFNGALQLHYVDINLPGNGEFDLQIVRSYNSTAVTPYGTTPPSDYSPAGLGWTIHFGRVLAKTKTLPCAGTPAFDTQSNPVLELQDGSRQLLAYTESGSPPLITTRRWKAECVTSDSAQGFIVYSPDGTRYEMTRYMSGVAGTSTSPLAAWYTTKIVDRNGNTATISYSDGTDSAEIQSITTSDDRRIDFTYTGGLITRISGPDGQTYRYDYAAVDGSQYQLTSVTRPDGGQWKFEYYGPVANASGGGAFAMKTLTYPQGGVISYAYDKVLFNALVTTYTSVVAKRTIGEDTWTYGYTPGQPGQFDTTEVDGPEGTTTYKHVGVNCTAPDSSCGDNTFGSNYLYAVGILVSKQIGDVQAESYGFRPQAISPQTYIVPGLWSTFSAASVEAPLITGRFIQRNNAGYSTTYSDFDSYGNPGKIVEEGPYASGTGRVSEISYLVDPDKWIINQAKDVVVTGVDGMQSTTKREFDDNGNLTSIIQDGVLTQYDYDPQGNLSVTVLPGDRTYGYSGYYRGIPRAETQPEGISIGRGVSDAGNVISFTDGNGHTTSYGYDALNRLTSIDYPLGSGVIINYGLNSKSATRGTLSADTIYDGFGRPVSVTVNGVAHTYEYDSLGRMLFASDPGGNNGIHYAYDILDRVTLIKNQDDTAQSISFGPASKTVTDERGKATTYYYRGYGDPDTNYLMEIAAPEPSANLVIERNGLDLVTSVSQGAYNNAIMTRSYGYDSRKYLTSETNPETGVTRYGRDDAGNMTSRQVGASGITTYDYDGQNRVTSIIYPDTTPSVTNTYTKTGKLAAVSSSVGNRSYEYDSNDNLIGESLAVGDNAFTIGYEYDDLDHLASITYPISGSVIHYAPDPLGRPTQASGYITEAGYWPSGQLKTVRYENGIVTNYSQNSRLLPSSLVAENAASSAYLSNRYEYDAAGNLAGISDTVDASYNRTFDYDGLNRLTTANGPWGNGQIAYDGMGNIGLQSLGSSGSAIGYTYDANNRLASLSGSHATSFSYDVYGNVSGAYGNSYVYDDAPNLICVNCSEADNGSTYAYDGLNNRVSITRGGVTTYEIYATHGHLLAEYTPERDDLLVESIYLGDYRVAEQRTGGTALTESTTTLDVSPVYIRAGDSVTLTASVSGYAPTGTVTFKDGAKTLGTSSIDSGEAIFRTTDLELGEHTVSAIYAGDANNNGSTATQRLQVNSPYLIPTSMRMSAPGSVQTGEPVEIMVSLSGCSSFTGSITVMDDSAVLGTVPVVDTEGTLTVTLGAGVHHLGASYSGDERCSSISGDSLATVTVKNPEFSIWAPTLPVSLGQDVALHSVLQSPACEGSVTFMEGDKVLGVADGCQYVVGGDWPKTTVLTRFDSPGVHDLTVIFRSISGLVLTSTVSITVLPAENQATFYAARDLKFDGSGNLYVLDGSYDSGRGPQGATVRKITPAGDVETIVGAKNNWDRDTQDAALVSLSGSNAMAVDGEGNLYLKNANTIRKVTPEGKVALLAGGLQTGNSDGNGAAASFDTGMGGVALDRSGNLFVADQNNHTIRKITPDGAVTTFAGTAGRAGSANGTGANARFRLPAGLAFDDAGNLFVADLGNYCIRKITPAGVVTTFAGRAGSPGATDGTGTGARFRFAYGLTFDGGGNLYVTDREKPGGSFDYTPRFMSTAEDYGGSIRRITPDSVVTTLVGGPYMQIPGTDFAWWDMSDGMGPYAHFLGTWGITADANGNLFVADLVAVRKITPSGVVTTYAGRYEEVSETQYGVMGIADGRINDTSLYVTPSVADAGQAVTLRAVVTGQNPSGTVTFHDGATALGTVSLSGNEASFTTTELPGGFRLLTATYNGDENNRSNTSGVTRLEVGPTVTSVTANPNPVKYGQPFTLRVNVTGSNPGGTARVQFNGGEAGTAQIVKGSGEVTVDTAEMISWGLPEGVASWDYKIAAYYNGDDANSTSYGDGSVTLLADDGTTATTTTLAAAPSPAVAGQTVTLTATLTGSDLTGAVTFKDGDAVLGTAPVTSVVATLTTTDLAAGTHSLTASYGGDDKNAASTSSAISLTIGEVDAKTDSQITLNVTPNPPTLEQSVTLWTVISGSSPTGSVTFMDGATLLGTYSLGATPGSYEITRLNLTLIKLDAGAHDLTASYSGDGANNGSTSNTVSLTVDPDAKTVTTTGLRVSPDPATLGQPVTLSAKVGGRSPTGTVTFKDGATILSTETLSSGRATYITSELAQGFHDLSASYSGDTNNEPSSSFRRGLTVE